MMAPDDQLQGCPMAQRRKSSGDLALAEQPANGADPRIAN